MNQDVFAGKWKQIRGELKSWWGKLADDDFDRIGGQKDKLIGVIQEKYGYTREKAQREVEERLKEYGDTMDGPSGNGKQDANGRSPRRQPWKGWNGQRVRRHSEAAAGEVQQRHGEDSRGGGGGIGARCDRHGEDSRSGRGGIGARCDRHSEDSRGGGSGIGEFVSARQKIRRYGNRPHRPDTPLPCPIVIGWRGPWLSPDSTHHEVNHGQ